MFVDRAQFPGFLKNIHLFGRLDDQQLTSMAELLQPVLVEKERPVYEIGSDALNLYFLYSGRIRLQRAVSEFDQYDAEIVPGDFFSLESISGEPYHLTSAVAMEDSIVLVVSGEQVDVFSREIPEMRDRLDLAVRSFNTMWNAALDWREPGEAIYYYARRHIIYMFIHMVGPLVFALIALTTFLLAEFGLQGALLTFPLLISAVSALVAVAWGFWSYFDWRNDFFVITDRRIVVFEKVILMFDSRTETPMEAVLAVNQRTSWLGRILRYGDVTVKSYTGTLMMSYLEAPQEVQQMIEYLLLRARTRKSSLEKRVIARTIKERLGKDQQAVVVQPPKAKPTTEDEEEVEIAPVSVKPGPLQHFIANFLHLRIEENGVLIYRKYWLILVQQAWAPTLILLLFTLVLFLRLINAFTLFPLGALVGVVLPLGFLTTLWWLYEYWDWTNDVYIITSEQLIDVDKRPLGTETRKAAPLKNILSIEYQRLGVVGNIFNFGTVFIKVGETTFTFDYVHDPRQVQRELFNRFSEVKERERKAQELAEQKRMADWIEGYHRWHEEEDTQGNAPPPSPGPYPI